MLDPELQALLSSPTRLKQAFSEKTEEFWLRRGQDNVQHLFSEVSKRVPAYQDFLKVHKAASYEQAPSTTKENYYDKYDLADLSLDGRLHNNYLICTSSGSSGKPHYWPRFKEQDIIEPAFIETAYSYLGIHEASTLIISCLAMGTWVAGNMMIDASLEIARQKNLNLTVITPGANNKQILEIIQDIGHHYDQILLIGYPPTVRNVIIEGIDLGIDWQKYKPKFVVGGEPISQHWKEFILDKVGSTSLKDIMGIFGMAEMHIVSFTTPLSVIATKILADNPRLCKKVFGSPSLAALVQYNPTWRWFEEEKGELVVSALCGVPLPKYRSHDLGGVKTYSQLLQAFSEAGYDLITMLEKYGYKSTDDWKLPFFYSLGRGDSVSLMGANIYPANIEKFFHKHHNINDFKIGVEHDENEKARFCIYFELRQGKSLTEEQITDFRYEAQSETLQLLLEHNEDFADAYTEEPEAMTPFISVHGHKEGPFSKRAMKQNHIAS